MGCGIAALAVVGSFVLLIGGCSFLLYKGAKDYPAWAEASVVNPADLEMLEDLILVAVNEAQKKAAELAKGEMGKLTGGLNLPFKLPF